MVDIEQFITMIIKAMIRYPKMIEYSEHTSEDSDLRKYLICLISLRTEIHRMIITLHYEHDPLPHVSRIIMDDDMIIEVLALKSASHIRQVLCDILPKVALKYREMRAIQLITEYASGL